MCVLRGERGEAFQPQALKFANKTANNVSVFREEKTGKKLFPRVNLVEYSLQVKRM